jgi:hypothetical protein
LIDLAVKDLGHPSPMPADFGKRPLGDLTLVKLIAPSRCSDDTGNSAMQGFVAPTPPLIPRLASTVSTAAAVVI